MSTYRVVKFGTQSLRKKASAIEDVNDDIRALAKDMLASMYAENGLGLAAEQIGRDEAICVIDVPAESACGLTMPLVNRWGRRGVSASLGST
jgi:peptide deformylase